MTGVITKKRWRTKLNTHFVDRPARIDQLDSVPVRHMLGAAADHGENYKHIFDVR